MNIEFAVATPEPAPTPEPVEKIILNGEEVGELTKATYTKGEYIASVNVTGLTGSLLVAGYGINADKQVAVEEALDELRGKAAQINKFLAEVAA